MLLFLNFNLVHNIILKTIICKHVCLQVRSTTSKTRICKHFYLQVHSISWLPNVNGIFLYAHSFPTFQLFQLQILRHQQVYLKNQKSMYNLTTCTCFAIVSKNQNWPRVFISFLEVGEKQRWSQSLEV